MSREWFGSRHTCVVPAELIVGKLFIGCNLCIHCNLSCWDVARNNKTKPGLCNWKAHSLASTLNPSASKTAETFREK